jgi:hypothetical protein
MRPRLRTPVALLLGGAAAFLVACGDTNGLLSPGDAGQLNNDMSGISSAVSNGDCTAAAHASARLRDDVNALPGTVDRRLLNALQDGASTVSARATRDCANAQTQTQTLQTQTQTTTVPTTTQTTPTTTQTTPTTTTPPPPPPPETTPSTTGTSPNGGASPGSGGIGSTGGLGSGGGAGTG